MDSASFAGADTFGGSSTRRGGVGGVNVPTSWDGPLFGSGCAPGSSFRGVWGE